MGKRRMQDHPDYIDPNQMIALEEEMAALKKEYGIVDKPKWWMRLGDFIANHAGTRQPVPVYRNISCWPCAWDGPAAIGFIRSSMPWGLFTCCFAGPEFRLQ